MALIVRRTWNCKTVWKILSFGWYCGKVSSSDCHADSISQLWRNSKINDTEMLWNCFHRKHQIFTLKRKLTKALVIVCIVYWPHLHSAVAFCDHPHGATIKKYNKTSCVANQCKMLIYKILQNYKILNMTMIKLLTGNLLFYIYCRRFLIQRNITF